MAAASIRIMGLDELDRHELSEDLSSGEVEFETPEAATGAHPEPGTVIAVVLLTSAAIQGLTAWLLKKRHQGEIEKRVVMTDSSGRVEERTLRVRFKSSEPSEVAQQIVESLGVDPSVAGDLLGGS
jgi:hypothetical protein